MLIPMSQKTSKEKYLDYQLEINASKRGEILIPKAQEANKGRGRWLGSIQRKNTHRPPTFIKKKKKMVEQEF